jgi:protein kinase A
MENTHEPQLENVKVIKHLYSTKLSKVWLISYNNEHCILKGKATNTISDSDYSQLKQERAFLDTNKNTKFPVFKKAFRDSNYLYMLISFFEGVTLSTPLLDKELKFNTYSSFEEFEAKKRLYLYVVIQLLEMMDYLHRNHIIYRDLKMNNIIINDKFELFLIDFGFNKRIENRETTTVCGTYHIMAPEVFKNKFQETPQTYGFKSDIYSFGIFLFELFVGKPPFDYVYDFGEENLMSYYKIISEGIKESYFESFYVSQMDSSLEIKFFVMNLKDLIMKCLLIDPEKRCSVNEIRSHPLFEGNYEEFKNYKLNGDKYENELIKYIEFNGDFVKDYIKDAYDPFKDF